MSVVKDAAFALTEATFDIPDGPSNLTIDEQGNVKYATLAKLVTKMTTGSEFNLIYCFLLTYRSYTTGGKELLTALQLRESGVAKKDPKSIIRFRLFNVVKIWVEKYWYDFERDCPELSDNCLKWLEKIAADPNNSTYFQVVNSISQNIKRQWNPDKKDKEKLIKDKMDKEESLKADQRAQLEKAPKPNLPRDFGREPINLFALDAEEIARQMTLFDWKLWAKITNVEFIDLAWKLKDKEKTSPNLLAMLNRFAYVSEWVSSVICLCEKTKERAKLVLKFLEIATKLRALNNFNGCFQIAAGLNAAPVASLKETFSIAHTKIPKGIMTLDELNIFTSPAGGYTNIKKVSRACHEKGSPQFPYIQMHLNQLVILYQEKNFVGPNHLINFAKQSQIWDLIRDLLIYQETFYCYLEVPEIQAKLKGEPTFTESQLTQMSSYLEPLPGKEKGTRPAALFDQQLRQVDSPASVPLQEGLWTQCYGQPESPSNTEYRGTKIVGLTLHRLIERITHPETPDVRLQAYIANLKQFCTPSQFLDALILRFNIPNPVDMSEDSVAKHEKYFKEPIQIRVIRVIGLWVQKSWGEDFLNDPQLKRRIDDFIADIKLASSMISSGGSAGVLPIQHVIDKIQKFDPTPVPKVYPVSGIAPQPAIPRNENLDTLQLAELDAFEVAQQLTLMLNGLWLQVSEAEYRTLSFSESGYLSKLEGAQTAIEAWVLNEVLGSKNQDENSVHNAFNKLIQIAAYCATLNNLLAQFAMVSAFKSLIDAKKVDFHLCKQENVLFLEQNTLDSIISKSCFHEKSILQAPCVPAISAIKKDFNTINKTHPHFMISSTIICIEKVAMLDDLLQFKQKLQSQAYNLIPVPIIQQYLAIPRKMPKVEGQIFPGGIKGAVIDLITKDPCIEGELSKIIKCAYGPQGNDRFSQFRVVLREVLSNERMDSSFLLIENETFRFTLARSFSKATFASWSAYDANCQVYAEPSEVSCIIMTTVTGTNCLIDMRDKTTNFDIANLLRLGNFYLQVVQPPQPIGCVLVTKHISAQTTMIAQRCEIQVLLST